MTELELAEEVLSRDSIVSEIERRFNLEDKYRPVVTISREPGSGGKPIGQLLAKKLKYRFYDRSLIEKVGKRLNQPTGLLEKIDEKGRSGITDFVRNMFDPDYVSDEVYFRNLCQVILKLTQKGGAVIVGRGANFVIPQFYGLRVLITAPYRVRVARAVEFEKVSRDKAREIIKDVTDDRVNYVRQYFGKNIMSPKYYDLSINTTFFSIEQAVNLIVTAFKTKFPGN